MSHRYPENCTRAVIAAWLVGGLSLGISVAAADESRPDTPPALEIEDMDGKVMSLADWRGQVVLVNFWMSWCPPCVHEMPALKRLRRALADDQFEILAVNLGEPASTVAVFAERQNLNFPVFLNPHTRAIRDWRLFAYPTSVLIDRRGRMLARWHGPRQWDSPEMMAEVKRVLPERRVVRRRPR